MPRRLLAAAAALLIAVLGAAVLIGYAHGADARAQAGQQLVPVLVVTTPVKAGTSASALAGAVSVQQVPRRLAAPGSVADLASLAGKVTDADLLPGDQVLTGRFASPSALLPAGTVAVPDGMVQVSVSLQMQQAAGGVLKAGDQVGVQLTEVGADSAGVAGLSVFRVLHGVLVTKVAAPSAATADPSATYTITLAVSPTDAQTVVLGATAAHALWLSLEKPGVGPASGTASGSTTVTTTTSSTSGGTK